MTSRELTGFESMFASLDVRLISVLEFHEPILESLARDQLSQLLQAFNFPSLTLQLQGETRVLELRDVKAVVTGARVCDASLPEVTNSIAGYSSHETMQCQLLLREGGLCQGISCNINHAVIDGMTMVAFWQSMAKMPSTLSPCKPYLPPAFGPNLTQPCPEPSEFLPLPTNQISIASLFAQGADDASHQRALIPAAMVQQVRRLAKARGCRFTAVLTAALQLSLADTFFIKHPEATDCGVVISTLVDMRPHLPSSDHPEKYQLAVSTVNLGVTMERNSMPSLLTAASNAQQQLDARLQNGEHMTQALALSQGRFDEGAPSATLELSNLGPVFPQGTSHRLHLAQRFDGYDGVSILSHTHHEGCVLTASVGAGLSGTAVLSLLSQACDVIVAACN
eukprot:m.43892 g.43892  ORF g.43892 m.43892 type:complete len:395 (-) comp12972_c0_seq1:200-1384(-)